MADQIYRAWMRRLQDFLAAPQPRRTEPAQHRAG